MIEAMGLIVLLFVTVLIKFGSAAAWLVLTLLLAVILVGAVGVLRVLDGLAHRRKGSR